MLKRNRRQETACRRDFLRAILWVVRGWTAASGAAVQRACGYRVGALRTAAFLRASAAFVKRSVQAGRTALVAGVAREAAAADGKADLKSRFQCFRHLGRFKPRVLPVLHDDTGAPFPDAEAEAEAVQKHFTRIVKGTVLADGVPVPAAGLVLDALTRRCGSS